MQKSISKLWSILKIPRDISSHDIAKLFHYTHNAKKEKIVRENDVVFRLSRVDCFLDKNEGFQILEPYYHACGQFCEESKGEKKQAFYEMLMSIGQQDLLSSFTGVWVACFSKNGNSSFMKRRYAAGDGWILGVGFYYLGNLCIDFPVEFGTINLLEIQYSFNRMVVIIKNALEKCYKVFEKEENQDFREALKQNIVQWLGEYSLIYKSADYKLEEEIRLVCKFASGFSVWEDAERGIKIEASINGYDPVVELILDKKYLLCETQEPSIYFDTKLNKTIVTTEEIRKVRCKK